MPAVGDYETVCTHLEHIAAEKLETTGPKMVVKYAPSVADLQGDYKEHVLNCFIGAAKPVLQKSVTSMANIRDVVLSVGPEGVQDSYVSFFLVFYLLLLIYIYFPFIVSQNH